MTRQQLIDKYVAGQVSRRSFIRGMVALGSSVEHAVQLANKYSDAHHNAATELNG